MKTHIIHGYAVSYNANNGRTHVQACQQRKIRFNLFVEANRRLLYVMEKKRVVFLSLYIAFNFLICLFPKDYAEVNSCFVYLFVCFFIKLYQQKQS